MTTPLQARKYANGLVSGSTSAGMLRSLSDQVESLTKERDALMSALETLHKHASEEFAATPKLGNACLTAGWQIAALKKAGVQ